MFYSIKEVSKRYGVSPKSIWRWIREGRFPKPVKLAPKTARWRETDLQAYEDGLDG
ncbi:helix-turn-helix transcriptional regulator [Marinobacter sp. SS8-8]|uniref:helix-turn-helix transcriptional regulator n=1 Tax=Marinobacter sp. SS8-8 TaxID=3050452 RepID=UPI0034A4C9AA